MADFDPKQNPDPTAGYKPLPKSPSFGIVVALAAAAFLIILAIALFVVKSKGTKMDPHTPNPTPNSVVVIPAKSQNA